MSPAEVTAALDAHGWARLTGVVEPHTLSALRAAMDRALDAAVAATGEPDQPGALERRTERLVAAAHDPWPLLRHILLHTHEDPELVEVVERGPLAELAAALVAPLTVRGVVVRPRVNSAHFPPSEHPWHQDLADLADPESGRLLRLALWIPLADATASGGTIAALPGAWTAPLPHEARQQGPHHFFAIRDDALPDVAPHPLPCDAGDLLVLHRFLPHRTLPNETDRARWAVVVWVKAD